LVLRDFSPLFSQGVTFKGGTAISKIHCGFRRLSEDLDFAIPVPMNVSRPERRKRIEAVKLHLDQLANRIPFLRTTTPLNGHDEGRHYRADLAYVSVLSSDPGRIKLEFGMREPLEEPVAQLGARTLLADPLSGSPFLDPVVVSCLTLCETFAEKWRAALTREKPAIRDYWDIDDALRGGILAAEDTCLHALIKRKLERVRRPVPASFASSDLRQRILEALRPQLDPGLRPVLRRVDYESFDLERSVESVLSVLACARELTRIAE
jgi:hypothetical protein